MLFSRKSLQILLIVPMGLAIHRGTAQSPAPGRIERTIDGIQVQAGASTLEVTALRPDVLRVRATHQGRLPEDASWAVLSSARQSKVRVVAEEDGFST